MSFGPFVPGLDGLEIRTRLRCLRLAVKIITGPRGLDCRHALLRAEIEPDEVSLTAAAQAFESLTALDRRRVLTSYAEVADAPSAPSSRRST